MAEAFTLRFEHASGEGMRDAALAATMYRLEVHLGDRCLTQALDKANRGVVEGTYVSLLPVAIWAVDCWWLLAHEGARGTVRSLRQATAVAEKRWHRRHNWLAFREGFALPELVFSSEGDDGVRIDAFSDPDETGSMPLRFMTSGSWLLDREQLQDELSRLVEAVLSRCADVQERRVAELRSRWDIIRTASPTEALACCRAARLGLDCLDAEETDDELSAMLSVPPPVVESVFEDMLDVVQAPSAARLTEQSQRLAALLKAAESAVMTTSPADRWGMLSRLAGARCAGVAFARGYELATALRREVLGVDATVVGEDLDEVLRRHLAWVEQDAGEGFLFPGIKALVARTNRGPYVAMKPGVARRFDKARCLHMMMLSEGARLVTASYAPDQQASRAFAAELLAPAEWLRARILGSAVDWDTLPELAAELKVSDLVVQHQVDNHGLAGLVGG